jgi:hypothetical protein
LSFTSTGGNNTGIGTDALYSNTTASNNTAIGYQAGYTNTVGTGSNYFGRQAGYSSNANYNTMMGDQAGYVSTGIGNTFFGYSAGGGATSATYNTFVGYGAGYYITTGGKHSILGCYTGNQGGLDIRTASNYIVLSDGDGNPRGYCNGSGAWSFPGSVGTVSTDAGGNYLIFSRNAGNFISANGGTSATITVQSNTNGVILTNGATAWASASDENTKDIIEPITNAAQKVSTLRAIIGKYKTDPEGTRRSFLIAQDVQAVLPEAVSPIIQEDESEILGLEYTGVIPLLVAAIKEHKADLDATKAELAALKGPA